MQRTIKYASLIAFSLALIVFLSDNLQGKKPPKRTPPTQWQGVIVPDSAYNLLGVGRDSETVEVTLYNGTVSVHGYMYSSTEKGASVDVGIGRFTSRNWPTKTASRFMLTLTGAQIALDDLTITITSQEGNPCNFPGEVSDNT